MNALTRIGAAQDRALVRLREGSPDRELLVQLLESSCLLELAKLDASLDLGTCVQQAADIVAAMFPVTGCVIALDTDDGEPWVVTSGVEPAGALVRYRSTIRVDGGDIGELRLGPLTADLDAQPFVDAAAEQLAAQFARALESDRLRRSAATANAARLAAELDGESPEESLEGIATHLAAFPGALAAELLVDHPAVGAPLTVRSGTATDVVPVVISRAVPGSGVLAARVSMRAGAPPPDAALGEVLDRIVGSLSRIEREQQLRRDVETDPLTGLGNRRRLDRALSASLARARRYGEHVAVLLLDLDGFKAVNDTLGHDAGDRVLRTVARATRRVTRGYDEVVRLGGDELVVVSPATELLGSLTLADSIRRAIADAAAEVLPDELTITVSVGIALFPDSAGDPDALLRSADVALYDAKAAGKNCVAVAPVHDLVTEPPVNRPVDGPAAVSAASAVVSPPAPTRRRFFRL
jgi:diguanylate cyclase (GGDEF)-like protein